MNLKSIAFILTLGAVAPAFADDIEDPRNTRQEPIPRVPDNSRLPSICGMDTIKQDSEKTHARPRKKALTLPYEPVGYHLSPIMPSSTVLRNRFDELIAKVGTIEDYRRHLQRSRINYSTIAEQRSVRSEPFTNPFTTYQRGHGVCDELALYFAAFFSGKNEYEIYILDLLPRDDFRIGHSAAIYKHPSGMWGYSDNTEVSDPIFVTRDDTIESVVLRMNVPLTTPVSVFISEALKPGGWMYEGNMAPKTLFNSNSLLRK